MSLKKRNPESKKSIIFTETYDLRQQAIELSEKFKDIKIDKKLLK